MSRKRPWSRGCRPCGAVSASGRGNGGPRPPLPTRASGHCHGPWYRASTAWVWHRVLIMTPFSGGIMSALFSLHSSSTLARALRICVPMALLGAAVPRPWPTRISAWGRPFCWGRQSSRHHSHARLPANQIHHGQGWAGVDPGAGQGVLRQQSQQDPLFRQGVERGSGVGVAIPRQPTLHQAHRGVRQFGREQGGVKVYGRK